VASWTDSKIRHGELVVYWTDSRSSHGLLVLERGASEKRGTSGKELNAECAGGRRGSGGGGGGGGSDKGKTWGRKYCGKQARQVCRSAT
jgi:hypothetical protein